MLKYIFVSFLFYVNCFCTTTTDRPCLTTVSSFQRWEPDYYWRDYHGVIPNDAVKGGFDVSGNITYIGQITIENKIVLPGVIYPGIKMMYVPYKGHRSDDKYVKILCSQHEEKLAWIPTKSDELHLLTDYHLVVGGYEQNKIAFIGRINYENNVIVGKVFANEARGLRIVNPKKEEMLFSTFEVLGYARG